MMFRALPVVLVTALSAAPATAQEQGDLSEGFSLLQEGTRLMLRGLLNEMEPALRDLGAAIDDLSAYHAPEILPNGDIILRRKVPLEPELPPSGEIDL